MSINTASILLVSAMAQWSMKLKPILISCAVEILRCGLFFWHLFRQWPRSSRTAVRYYKSVIEMSRKTKKLAVYLDTWPALRPTLHCMMSSNNAVILKKAHQFGPIKEGETLEFKKRSYDLKEPGPGEFIVKALYLSIDPYLVLPKTASTDDSVEESGNPTWSPILRCGLSAIYWFTAIWGREADHKPGSREGH